MTTTEQRVMETRLDSELFGRRYWASLWESTQPKLVAVARASDDVPSNRVEITPAEAASCGDIWNHNAYCSDWSLLPSLIAECKKRDWVFRAYGDASVVEPWVVHLVSRQTVARKGGDTLPLALSLAIVAVLTRTVETEKARDV